MIAFVVALVAACALPKRVERGRHPGPFKGALCTSYEMQPLAAYGIESALGTRIGIAYSAGEDC